MVAGPFVCRVQCFIMAPKATRRTPQKAAGRGRKVGGRRASAKQAARQKGVKANIDHSCEDSHIGSASNMSDWLLRNAKTSASATGLLPFDSIHSRNTRTSVSRPMR